MNEKKGWMRPGVPTRALALLLVLVLTLGLAGCGKTQESEETEEATGAFRTVDSISEAKELTGFGLVTPIVAMGYTAKKIQAVPKKLIQVVYLDEDNHRLIVRKGKGEESVSSDYNKYPQEKSAKTEDGMEVTLRGEYDVYYSCTWTKGKYAYSIDIAQGAEKAQLLKVANILK